MRYLLFLLIMSSCYASESVRAKHLMSKSAAGELPGGEKRWRCTRAGDGYECKKRPVEKKRKWTCIDWHYVGSVFPVGLPIDGYEGGEVKTVCTRVYDWEKMREIEVRMVI